MRSCRGSLSTGSAVSWPVVKPVTRCSFRCRASQQYHTEETLRPHVPLRCLLGGLLGRSKTPPHATGRPNRIVCHAGCEEGETTVVVIKDGYRTVATKHFHPQQPARLVLQQLLDLDFKGELVDAKGVTKFGEVPLQAGIYVLRLLAPAGTRKPAPLLAEDMQRVLSEPSFSDGLYVLFPHRALLLRARSGADLICVHGLRVESEVFAVKSATDAFLGSNMTLAELGCRLSMMFSLGSAFAKYQGGSAWQPTGMGCMSIV
ncbi:hypothetical protein WJX72_001555 [[Myrmecia] bisecta]|uniref:Uncharacterized protein n=1 Tax=[Myrmecia] bisecta TaxID=41462 RepID=A0AAW1P9L0_9CHLO